MRSQPDQAGARAGSILARGPQRAGRLQLPSHPGQVDGDTGDPPICEHARIATEVGRCADKESVRLVDPLPVDVTEIADEERSRLLGRIAALLQGPNRGHVAHADVNDRDGKEDRDCEQRPA